MNDKSTGNTFIFRILVFLLCLYLPFQNVSLTAYATADELKAEAEERKNNPVESNEVEGWPEGPKVGADAAIVMDLATGAILYSKNMDAREFPASTTKIMTSLLAVENCNLDEIVTVSQSAIDANASDGSNMGLKAGEQLTVEQILYGILINSANEGCNAIAEHISGSMDAFVELMNRRAEELGCTNTHFVTTNGLHNEEHYTSAHDLALIAREFFSHDILGQMARTPSYTIAATATNEEHNLKTHNKLYEGMEYAYPYLVGSKTGFTSNSRQCLVSCAEKDGMRLICVIMKEESPYQFEDTIQLFEYGFANFSPVNIAANEERFSLHQAEFFYDGADRFGSTGQLLYLDTSSKIILPQGVSFSDLDSEIVYSGSSAAGENAAGDNPEIFATVNYSYHSMYLGSGSLLIRKNTAGQTAFTDLTASGNGVTPGESTRKMVDVRIVILIVSAVLVLLLAGLFVYVRTHNIRLPFSHGSRSYRRKPGKSPAGQTASKRKRNYSANTALQAGMHRISRQTGSEAPLRKGRDHVHVTEDKPQKRKPGAFELKFQQIVDSISDLSEAKRVEAAKQARREREIRMRRRLLEEAEQHRISGQSSIRTKSGQKSHPQQAYDFDAPHTVSYEEEKQTTPAHRRGNSLRSRLSGAARKQRPSDYDYTEEELELLRRQEQRRRLAQQRRREMNHDK